MRSVYQTEAACQALGEGQRGHGRVLLREAGALPAEVAEQVGIYDLAGACAERPGAIRSMFGKNGEYLIDHAWGLEPATIADCRGYVPKARSLSNVQVLMRHYAFPEARTVAREMVFSNCMDLAAGMLACDTVGVWAGCSGSALRGWDGAGEPPAAWGGGQRRLGRVTSSERLIEETVMGIFDTRVSRTVPIRRVEIALSGVVPDRKAPLVLFDEPDAGRERPGAQPPDRVPPCVAT